MQGLILSPAGHERAGGSDPADPSAAAAQVGVRVEEEDMCIGVRYHGSKPADPSAVAAQVGVRVEEEDMGTGVRHHCSNPADPSAVAAQVGVRVEEEDMCTGVRHHCCSAYLTFVSVLARGGAGRPPRALPRLEPTNRLHSAIYEAAEQCGPPRPSEHSKAAHHSPAARGFSVLALMLCSLSQHRQVTSSPFLCLHVCVCTGTALKEPGKVGLH